MLLKLLKKYGIEKCYTKASHLLTVSEVNCLDLLDRNCLLKVIKLEYLEHAFSYATVLVAYDLNNRCVFRKTLREDGLKNV